MTEPRLSSDQKADNGQLSIWGVLRDIGPAGLPAVFLFVAIILLRATGSQVSYNAPSLTLALYFIFSLLMPLLIVFLVSRSFLIKGEIGLLMFGCGVVIWSISGVPALVLAKSDPNITFTIYNMCLWMSALCHFIGANVSLRPRQHLRSTGLWLAGAYIGALCCVGFIIYITLEGWTPTFFVPGQGGTPIRQWVLGSAVVMFILSAVLLKAPVRNPSVLLNWYALALLLIAAGLIGFMFQSSVDSLLVWASRSALYLSGVYMLIAAIASFRESHAQLYNELRDLALDGIVVHKIASETFRGNFIQANPAMCTMLGYTQEEMHKFTPLDIMIPQDLKSVPAESKILIRDKMLRHTKTLLSKDGLHIPVEINTRLYEDHGRPMALSIIRDITKRKEAEDALYNAAQLSSALNRINESLHSNLNTREVLQILVNEGAKALGCETAGLSLLRENVWTVSVVYGFPESFVGATMNNDEELHAMLAVRTQRPVAIDDAFNDVRVNRDHMRKHNIRSVLVVPLIVRNEPLGALFLNQQTAPKTFSEAQVQFATQLASTASIALVNSRLFEEQVQAAQALRESEEELRLANESLEQRVRERTMDLQNLTKQLEKSRHALRKLASELVMAEQRERKRISEVLHDDIAQILAAIRMRLDLLQGMPSDQKDKQALIEAKAFLLQTIQETRALMNELGNPLLFDLGLKPACESLADRLMKTNQVRITCDIGDAYKNLNPDMKILLYQVVRELLNNVMKHSRAKNSHLLIDMENEHFRVKVADDGVGFDPQTLGVPTVEGGFGLYSIRERLMAIDGSLTIESAPETTGTVVTAILPAALD